MKIQIKKKKMSFIQKFRLETLFNNFELLIKLLFSIIFCSQYKEEGIMRKLVVLF